MAEKVLLILVDGMRSDSIPLCGDQGFEALYKKGAYSMKATTVFPPVTLPAHMSLFHSVDPERHGIISNIFVQQNHPIDGIVEGLAAAGKTSAFFYMWEQLRDLCTPGKHLSFSWFMSWRAYAEKKLDWRVTLEAEKHIAEVAPDFVFLYLGETDEFGHQYGWMGPEYLASVKNAYDCIEHIRATLPSDYSVIITADHGGHNRMHGQRIPEDMTIPITFLGKRFAPGTELENLNIKDIAPTIMDIMGLAKNPEWEGKSVLEP